MKILILLLFLITIQCATEKDYYKILNVSKTASSGEIKKAYKKLSLEYHPDKNKDPKANEIFMNVAEAYEVLSDPEKRSTYDKFGIEGLKKGDRADFTNPFDMFFQWSAGFGGSGNRNAKRKAPSTVLPLIVSLETVYQGKSVNIEFNKQVICYKCDGSGAKDADDVVTCTKCNGRGVVVQMRELGGGFIFQQVQTNCDQCNGKGKVSKSVCSFCKGKRVVSGNNELTVDIDKGVPEGHRIVLEEESEQSPDFVPGDLELIVTTSLHPVYKRDGNNLYAQVVLTLIEAMTGFKREMVHLDGSKFVLSGGNSKGKWKVVQPGQVETVPGKGMPIHEKYGSFGDLFVEYQVVLPESVDLICAGHKADL